MSLQYIKKHEELYDSFGYDDDYFFRFLGVVEITWMIKVLDESFIEEEFDLEVYQEIKKDFIEFINIVKGTSR